MDVKTMAVMVGAVNVLLAVVLFAQYRFNKNYAGLGWWAAGQATVAVGFVVSTFRGDSLAGRLAVPGYQALLVLGSILIYVGVVRFLGRRERMGWLIGLWLALLAWSTFHTFDDDSPTLRSVGLYLTIGLVLALTYLVLAGAEPMRTQVTSANAFYAPSPVNAGAFLAALACTILWTFGLVVMINQRLAAEIALDARNMHSIFATSPDCAIISRLSDGHVGDVNAGFTRLTGFAREEAIGKSAVALGLWVDPSVREEMVRGVEAGTGVSDIPMVLQRKDGSTVDCLLSASRLTLEDEPYLIALVRDVTQQRRMEAALLHEATTDSLTGLPNRRHFLSVCERELRRAARSGGAVAVAVVDIDHFKDINDTHGHATGDAAVVAFAQAVQARIRDIDTFGRLGGDEFGVLLPDTDLDRAMGAIERVREDLAAVPCVVGEYELTITISAGVAVVRSDADTIDTVLARADKALYEAKALGRDRVVASSSDEETARA